MRVEAVPFRKILIEKNKKLSGECVFYPPISVYMDRKRLIPGKYPKKENSMDTNKECGINCGEQQSGEYETVHIEKTRNICAMCENFSKQEAAKPIPVMSCEGACLRGEIAKQAANLICHSLLPEKTVRICLGGAFTKDTGQRNLVRNSRRLIALEGCLLACSSRMMQAVIPGLKPEVIIADQIYQFNRNLFGINEMPELEIKAHSQEVARKILAQL